MCIALKCNSTFEILLCRSQPVKYYIAIKLPYFFLHFIIPFIQYKGTECTVRF